MTSDELVSSLSENLEAAANSDVRLRSAVVQGEVVDCLQQGLAVEGHIDFSPLREKLLEKAAAGVVDGALLPLRSFAAANGFTIIDGMFTPAPAAAPVENGFLPLADLQKERDILDRALVAVVVRNTELHADMEQFRQHLGAAMDQAAESGRLELEPLDAFLRSTDSEETVRHETLLTLLQTKTKYTLILPASLNALSDTQRTSILEAFNKRCPAEVAPPSVSRAPRQEKKEPKPPAFVPLGKQKPKKKSVVGWLVFGAILVVGAAGGALYSVAPPAPMPRAELTLPPSAMPCSKLLADGKVVFCGLNIAAWKAIAERDTAQVQAMKTVTADTAKAAGYASVRYGIDTGR